jgi:hypothetical protein
MRRFRFEVGGEHKFREQRFCTIHISGRSSGLLPEGGEIRLAVTMAGGTQWLQYGIGTLSSKTAYLRTGPAPGGLPPFLVD